MKFHWLTFLAWLRYYINISADLTKGFFGHFIRNYKNILNFNILHVLKIESNCFLLVIQSKAQ